jgi:hypothetical protein
MSGLPRSGALVAASADYFTMIPRKNRSGNKFQNNTKTLRPHPIAANVSVLVFSAVASDL